MKGLIPAFQELADSMGKAFNEVLYGTESDSDKKYINIISNDIYKLNPHTIKSLKSSNWRKGGRK